ncbi:hypothetical protein [Lelliottia nimipressuralis]
MKPLLILLTPLPPPSSLDGWLTLWCAPPSTAIRPATVDRMLMLPTAPVVPLCQALLAVQCHSPLAPVGITTGSVILTHSAMPPAHAMAWLEDEDRGVLWFPQTEWFMVCAEQALRDRDPSRGVATLRDAWEQALLMGWADDAL